MKRYKLKYTQNNKKYKKVIIYSCIFIIFILILKSYYYGNEIEDITIFNIWKKSEEQIEYEVIMKKKIEINVFETYNNNFKKILPGSKGSFIIKIKNPLNLNYKINLKEKTVKPQNLVFIIENKMYKSLEEIESVINQHFFDKEKIVINWEWKYYINDEMDIIDTKDGEIAQKYIFELIAVI